MSFFINTWSDMDQITYCIEYIIIILKNLLRFWISNYTEWLHQPDNWGTTKDHLFAYAKRFNEYGQQYAAIDGK